MGGSDKRRIIVADDQFINIEVLRSHLIEFEDKFNIDYLYNGDRALKKAQNIIEQAHEKAVKLDGRQHILPVNLMLIDY